MTARLDRHVVGHLLAGAGVNAWGVARNHPALPLAPGLPTAISMMMRLDVDVVREIAEGPTPAYLEEYRRLNRALDLATGTLAKAITENGSLAERVRSTQSVPDDEPVFPHKTAATQAGLGWIGKTGLFVSRQFGSAVRLATVFTDLPLTAAQPFLVGHCGTCDACVRACPAGAGRDVTWTAGMPREQIIDVVACRRQMECAGEATLHDICGICIAACPRCLLADPVA